MDPILKKLKEELAANAAEMRTICETADTAERELDEDEQSTFDTLATHCDSLKERIAKREAQLEARSRISDYDTTAASPTKRVSSNRTPDVRVVAEGFEEDPKGGFKTPREFLTAIMDSSTKSRADVDKRLVPLAAAGSDEHGEYHGAFGGFLVPEGFSPQLLSRGAEMDPTIGRTTRVPMQSPSLKIPARTDQDHSTSVSGGLRVYRRAEADTVSSSRMEIERVTLNVHSLMGVAYATDEILTDSPISFAALISAGFGDEFTSAVFKEKLQGTGVGEYEGVNNSPALISVAKETGQDADTIVYENIVKMYARLWGKDQGVWIANHNCIPQLMLMNQAVGTGGTAMIWQPSARAGVPGMLLGLPIFFSEHAETVGDAGDIILCNWSQYLEGSLGGTESASSIHVRFVNKEETFRFSQRNDGRGWWRAALTPDKGSTLSPFVRLAARA